jgi:hypothetical protein
MTRIIYISPDGKEFPYLPRMYNNVSPINQNNYLSLGWTTRTEELPDPEEPDINPSLATKEKFFVSELMNFANTLGIDITTIQDINIGNLKTAASTAGATDEQIAMMSAALTTAILDIMAETDQPWGIAWPALKSRIPGYIQELMSS